MATTEYDSTRPDVADEAAEYPSNPVEVTNFHVTFHNPDGYAIADPQWTLEEIMPFIKELTETTDFGDRFDYLPDLLSAALYGTPDFWPILMELNGAGARSDFKGPTFRYVKRDSFGSLLKALRLGRDRRLVAADVQYEDITVREVPVR